MCENRFDTTGKFETNISNSVCYTVYVSKFNSPTWICSRCNGGLIGKYASLMLHKSAFEILTSIFTL